MQDVSCVSLCVNALSRAVEPPTRNYTYYTKCQFPGNGKFYICQSAIITLPVGYGIRTPRNKLYWAHGGREMVVERSM